MNHGENDHQLGEYRLQQQVGENEVSRKFLAEQISINRMVLIDVLREDRQHLRESFMADVRVKAAVDHPLVGSVYEAVADSTQCYYAHELLHGVTLHEQASKEEHIAPARLANLLRKVSEAQLQLEALRYAAAPIGLDSIFVDSHRVVRLKNLAIAGPRPPGHSIRDVLHLGETLPKLVADGQPGTTRMATLLSWMRGEEHAAPISWAEVREYCVQIEHQLTEPSSALTPTLLDSRNYRRGLTVGVGFATIAALIAIFAIAMHMRPPPPTPALMADLPKPIRIQGGKFATFDGGEITHQSFDISAHEITIGQYAEFLERLAISKADAERKIFDHPDQPPQKISHEPDDWPALLEAAKQTYDGSWHDHLVTLNSPVVGIDWWDANAYAQWKQGRLPNHEEWFAALGGDKNSAADILSGPWTPVTSQRGDRTSAGVIGMAGSVSEWTRKPTANPANPLGEKLWVIVGGSYLKNGSNALSREFSDNRDLRRPDLGFRVVWDVK